MNLFSLVAKLSLDRSEYDKTAKEAAEDGKSLGSRLASGLGTAAKVGGVALAGAATAITALTKQSLDSYAEYEQLVGGVETLFKGSADKVMQYANDAYKTAGLSANQYMETVTSFSASLLQSLGGDTAKAADMADMAITDMSDNANKMGTGIDALQNAYSGFAKQNFTMLDNLKLGYGGTKQEMERLLEDAEKLSGQKFDISSYADIVEAIHVVQTEMGITGTTAKEASSTISGSIAAMKSAWTNLVTGLGDENANLEQLIGNVVDSAVTAGNNLIPRVEQIIQGIGKLVEKLGPVIAEKLPGIIDSILPSMFSAATALVQSLTQSIPSLIGILLNVVLENLPMVIQMGLEIIVALAQGISQSLPSLTPTIVSVVMQIVDILTEPETLGNLIDAALQIIVALSTGMIDALPELLAKAPVIIANLASTLVSNAPKLVLAAGQLMGALAQGIIQSIGTVIGAIGTLWDSMSGSIGNFFKGAWDWGKDLINNFTEGIKAFISKPIDAIKGLAGKIKSFLGFSEPDEGPLSNFHTYAPDMMALCAEGIEANKRLITDAITEVFTLPDLSQAAASVGQAGGMNNSGSFEVPYRTRGDAGQTVATQSAGGQKIIDLRLILNDTEVGRVITPIIDAEHQRRGVKLVTGGAF